MALQFSGSAFTGSSAGLALRGQAEGKVEKVGNWVCVAVPAEGEVAEPQRPSQSQSHVQSSKGIMEERRIAGISMMQQRPKNSRRWIVPGSCAGPDGLTHRAVKKEVAVDPAVVDFSADLGRLKNSRKWSAARAEASSVIRSSGWRMHKTMAARAEAGNGSGGLTYKAAGVDIDAGAELVRRIAAMTPGIGGFGGLYPFGDSYLVAGTDGVGTKLKLAFETGIHDTIGIDLVAMSVNDIVTSGAKPLFFLDYFATSTLDVDLAEKVIQGIVEGCRMSDCALLGGETAEMPDFYAKGEYDLSGFAVGAVKKDRLIDGSKIVEGDVIIGLASSGVHSNGYSLVRKIIEKSGVSLNDELPNGGGITIGQALMVPTRIYVPEVMTVVNRGGVKGIAHITGGGFTENIPRIFPDGLGAHVELGQWKVPPIFHWLQKAGDVTDKEMFRTFNMGIGMVLVVDSHAGHSILTGEAGIGKAYRIGTVKDGDGVVFNSKKST